MLSLREDLCCASASQASALRGREPRGRLPFPPQEYAEQATQQQAVDSELLSPKPVSRRRALQTILRGIYKHLGLIEELMDVETEARLLTGEVFEEEGILSLKEASVVAKTVIGSAKLERNKNAETALELLEECLAARGFHPHPSILLG